MKKFFSKEKIILLVILFLFLLGLGILLLALLAPQVKLNGEKSVVVGIGGVYEELGVKARYLNKDVSLDVSIESDVDVEKKGVYTVYYSLKKGIYNVKVTRQVIVKDIEDPVIELKGNISSRVCPNKEYEEEGYSAYDNVDGDITQNVQRVVDGNEVIYTVFDAEGNMKTEKRTLLFEDTEKPKIELKGSSNYVMFVNDTYQEPGYTVSDNCDDAINQKVKITNSLDTKRVGTYTITYEVTDESANTQSVTRTVQVLPRPQGGVIYLTFDDGPNEGTTNVILDILKEEGVKATFFVTGNGPDYLIKREMEEGHTLALHTATHNYAQVYASVDAYFRDLQIIHDRVLNLTGQDVRIIRFPGGSSNTVSRNYCLGIMSKLVKEVVNRGYRYYDWNIDSNDAGGALDATTVYNNVIMHLSSTRINLVLMHDVKPQTRDALRNIIRYAKENGFTFETITSTTPMVTHYVNN